MKKTLSAIILASMISLGCSSVQKRYVVEKDQEKIPTNLFFEESSNEINNNALEKKTVLEYRLIIENNKVLNQMSQHIISSLIGEAKQKIKIKDTYSLSDKKQIFQTIGDILKNKGYAYDFELLKRKLPITRPLSVNLMSKKLLCSDYAQIYVSIGEALGLPIRTVNIPKHVFVRWDEDLKHNPFDQYDVKNKGDVNWEPLYNESISDKEYFSQAIKSNKDIAQLFDQGMFLHSNPKKIQIGDIYINHGIRLMSLKNFDDAIVCLKESLKYNDKSYRALITIGYVCSQKGKNSNCNKWGLLNDSIKYSSKAISLAPNHYDGHLLRGWAHYHKKDIINAKIDARRALELRENKATRKLVQAIALYESGEISKWGSVDKYYEHGFGKQNLK